MPAFSDRKALPRSRKAFRHKINDQDKILSELVYRNQNYQHLGIN